MPDLHETNQDFIMLGPVPSPGRAIVRNIKTPRKWDIAQGYLLSGATVRFAGNQLATFDVEFALWTDWHWVEWESFEPLLLRTPPGAPPKALGIEHPLLAVEGIRMVVITDVSGWDQDEYGTYRKIAHFLEYRGPRLALAKPAPIPSAMNLPPPATTQVQVDNMALLNQLQNPDAIGRGG